MTDFNLNASTRDSLIADAHGMPMANGEPVAVSVLETRRDSSSSAKMAAERQKLLSAQSEGVLMVPEAETRAKKPNVPNFEKQREKALK